MSVSEMHSEDIKALLRKRFGTIRQFELEYGLPKGSVHEVMRKRRWKRIEKAIESVLPGALNTTTPSPAHQKKLVNKNKAAA